MLGREPSINDYLPVGAASYYLQDLYIVENPNAAERRKLLDDAGDGSTYSRQHALYHPLLRSSAQAFGFFGHAVPIEIVTCEGTISGSSRAWDRL